MHMSNAMILQEILEQQRVEQNSLGNYRKKESKAKSKSNEVLSPLKNPNACSSISHCQSSR